MRIFTIAAVVVVAGLAVLSMFFTVDRTEYVYLTQLGRHVDTFDGADNTSGAGLHVKWPWPIQTVQHFDRRLQHFDLKPVELLTQDPVEKRVDKPLIVEGYVCWRIAGRESVDPFIRHMGTPDRAREILRDHIAGVLGARIVKMKMTDFFQYDPQDPDHVANTMTELRSSLLNDFQGTARREGIDIVDIRLRRLSHPPKVQPAIIDRIKSERAILVAVHTSEGQRESQRITSDAVRDASAITTRANAERVRLEGEGEAEADRIHNEAMQKDPQFYEFLKKLEASKQMFGDGKTVLLLSTHRELFDGLFNPPRLDNSAVPGKPAPEAPKLETPAK